jgi:hypothetical protein
MVTSSAVSRLAVNRTIKVKTILAQQQGEAAAEQQQKQAKQAIGAEIAGYGASGVSSGAGSALDVLASSASNAELDRQNLLYDSKLRALGYRDQSDLDNAAAGNAQTAGELKAGSALLTGAANIAGKIPTSSGGGATVDSSFGGTPIGNFGAS